MLLRLELGSVARFYTCIYRGTKRLWPLQARAVIVTLKAWSYSVGALLYGNSLYRDIQYPSKRALSFYRKYGTRLSGPTRSIADTVPSNRSP